MVKLLKLKIDVPSYTQICRRQASIQLPKLPIQPNGIHIVIDSSGLHIFGEGEWKVRQHGYDKRRTWRKLHIGIDEKSKLIVTALLTENKGRSHWKQQSGYHRRSLVENSFYRYKQLLGDKLVSRKLANQDAEAMIKCHILNKLTLIGMPLSVAV